MLDAVAGVRNEQGEPPEPTSHAPLNPKEGRVGTAGTAAPSSGSRGALFVTQGTVCDKQPSRLASGSARVRSHMPSLCGSAFR
jgi:hypothetical protein